MAVNLNNPNRRVPLPQRIAPGKGLDFAAARKRTAELQAEQQRKAQQEAAVLAFPTEEPPEVKQSFREKILSFTGGNKLALATGQALAQEETSNTLNRIQSAEGEMQQRLIDAIRKNREIGKDTSKLEAAFKTLTGSIADTGAGAEELLNPNKLTGKQVMGDAIQLAATVATVGGLPGAAKNAVKAPTFIKGAIAGAKTGVKVGAGFGAATGLSQGLKNDKDTGDLIKDTLVGTGAGALTGGLVGVAAGGAAGVLRGRALKAQKPSFVLDLVAPKATEKVKIQALKEGRVTEQGLLKASKILPSKRDKQLAEAVKDVVSAKKSAAQNLNAIESKVDDINTGVKAYVKVNKTPFNTNQLRTQLNKGKDDLNLIFASDTQAEKTYDAVVREFMKRMKNKDTSGLFQVRQEFDNVPAIKKLLDSQGLGENTKKEVVLTVRDMANRYIASLLPEGNQFRDTLLRESKMIEAMTNIAEKNSNAIGMNKLQTLTKKYPVIKWGVSLLATASGIGIGGAIIGSSD